MHAVQYATSQPPRGALGKRVYVYRRGRFTYMTQRTLFTLRAGEADDALMLARELTAIAARRRRRQLRRRVRVRSAC